MDVVLGSRDAPPATPGCPAPRVKAEASDNAHRNKGVLTTQLSNYGNLPQSDRPAARIKGSGAEIAEAGRGNVQYLFYRYGDLPQSGRPAARVKPEARGFAAQSKGSTMDTLLHGERKTYIRKSAHW